MADILELLPENASKFYNEHFSFVTGIASIIGLLAFASSKKIKSTDFENEEIEKFKSLIKTAEELESIEQNKAQTTQDLKDLERKKKLMEISIKKAGLILFYKEQSRKYSEIVTSKIENDKELKNAIEEVSESKNKLTALQEEMEKDENVDIIRVILEESEMKNVKREPTDPFELIILTLGEKAAEMLKGIARI
ncbi:MAG TPA: hypothetical protein ENK66_05995 [Arcobacter sp.]|nr:hypothetical protein [Arcobacter sp.]